MKLAGFALSLALFSALPARALAETPARGARVDARRDAPYAKLALGVRGQWWGSQGFDAFSRNDFTGAFSLSGDVTVWKSRRFSLAAGLGWDVSPFSGQTRGVDSSFTVHRVSIPLEARLHFTHWLYGFGKVAPGFVASVASLELEPDVGRYRDTRYAFSTDLALGAAFGLSPPRTRYKQRRQVRLWAIPEIGWSLAGKTTYALTPPDERPDSDVRLPGTTDPTRLPGFSASGPFFRVSLALAF